MARVIMITEFIFVVIKISFSWSNEFFFDITVIVMENILFHYKLFSNLEFVIHK